MSSKKTILALVGTKRKQSTYKILKMFEAYLQQYNFTMDYIFLHDIAFCSGCLRCVYKGIETCPHFGDIEGIIKKIIEADVLFFATPVYCDAISGIMKNFIDRLVYFMHRPFLFDKRSIIVTTTQYSGGKETIEYLDKMLRRWGCFPSGNIMVRMALFDKIEEEVIKDVEKVSNKLMRDIQKNKKPVPGLYELTYFRIMRVMVNYAKEEVPLDYKHWKKENWMETDFYCDAKISKLKNWLAGRIEKQVQKSINKQGSL